MKIVVIGSGYVGLVTGACFAERGHHVTCFDIDQKKIQDLKQGICPIYEPGLEELIHRNMEADRLSFTTELPSSSVYIIAVPTPADPSGTCDLSYVIKAAQSIGSQMTEYCLIITKSTVPVGTSEKIRAHLKFGADFDIVSNPEFLKEGAAITDCLHPDRIILGLESERAAKIMHQIYEPFDLPPNRIFIMDPPSAEMTKYAANAMLATRISFMNELAGLCEKLGANIHAVQQGIGSDLRIGNQFLNAGVGYGGSCFPKDVQALAQMAHSVEYDTPLLTATHVVNERQKQVLFKKISAYFGNGCRGKTIAIWGLAFKPNTDDLREAPALVLIDDLLNAGAFVRLYDPVAMTKAKKLLEHGHITWCEDEYDAAKGSDAVALLTEWKQFKSVDFEVVLREMKGNSFFDGRNQCSAEEMRERGFHYFGVGIPSNALNFSYSE